MFANDVNQMDEDNVTFFTSIVKTRVVRWQSRRMVEVRWLVSDYMLYTFALQDAKMKLKFEAFYTSVWRVNGQEKILLPVSDQSKFKRNPLKLPSSLTYKSLMHFHMWILAFHKPKPGSSIFVHHVFCFLLNRHIEHILGCIKSLPSTKLNEPGTSVAPQLESLVQRIYAEPDQ
ncbi:hypothetical protein Hanom_Chr03g00192911 [Helianthus anomalus]